MPTLVLHRTGDAAVNVEHGRYMARHIRGAKYVEFPGRDHLAWVGDSDSIVGEIESFLTGQRRDIEIESDRVLVAVAAEALLSRTVKAARRYGYPC